MPPFFGTGRGRKFMMTIDSVFTCAWCGETNETTVDPAGGRRQSYVEDCQVCCRPNVLDVEIDADGDAWIDARREND